MNERMIVEYVCCILCVGIKNGPHWRVLDNREFHDQR